MVCNEILSMDVMINGFNECTKVVYMYNITKFTTHTILQKCVREPIFIRSNKLRLLNDSLSS